MKFGGYEMPDINSIVRRRKGDTNSYQNKEGIFTTQSINIKSNSSNLQTQNLTVAKYHPNVREEKIPLITIRKGDSVIARFYNVRGEGEQIFMDILDPSLQKNFQDNKLPSKEVAITGLELDKKLDVRVKGLGKDLGVLFSAYGFQMQTPENNQVLRNDDMPYDIEIGENYIDNALKNTKNTGCLLGEDMKLNSPTMQGLLRASIFNENVENNYKITEKEFADGKVKLTSVNYNTTINNEDVRRPIQFIEMNGKLYTYLSIFDGLTERERNGQFYEISKIRTTKDNKIFLRIKDKSLQTIGNSQPNTRIIEISHNNDETLTNYIQNNILKNKEYENLIDIPAPSEEEIDTLSTNAKISNIEYGEREGMRGEKTKIFDSAGFGRSGSPLDDKAESIEVVPPEQPLVDIPDSDTIGNPNSTGDPPQDPSADEQPSPEAEQTPEPQPAPETPPVPPEPQSEPEPAPEPMPETPEAPSRDDAQGATSGAPNGAPTTAPAENENGRPKKRSVLDVPYAEDTTLKDYDPNKSNELAAKIGLGILGPSILLFFISAIVGIPLLGLIANAGMALATVTFTKPWEWAKISKSNAIARANAKLAKEKVKELKRERKAENKKEDTATLTAEEKEARKNKQLEKIKAEQDKIDEDDKNIEAKIDALNAQQALLIAGGGILDENGNPITLTDEELEEIGNQSEFLQRVDTDPELYQTVYKEINEGKEKGEERTPTINDYIAHWNKKITEKEEEISEASRMISNRSVNVLASVGELRSAAGEDENLQDAVRLMYSNALHGKKLEELRAGVDTMDETARQAEIEKEERFLTENNKKLKDMEDKRTIGLKLVTFHNLRDNYEKSEEERKQAIADKKAKKEELAKLKNERELLIEKRLNEAIGAEPSFADQFRQELYKQNQQQLEYLKARQDLNKNLKKNLEKQAERVEKGKDVEVITESQTTNFERTDAILDMQTGDGNEIVNKLIAQEQKEYEEARKQAQKVLDWMDDISKKRAEATLANDTDALNKIKENENGVLAYTDDLVKANSDQIKTRFETLQQTVYREFGRELPQNEEEKENARRAKASRNKANSTNAGGEGREAGKR